MYSRKCAKMFSILPSAIFAASLALPAYGGPPGGVGGVGALSGGTGIGGLSGSGVGRGGLGSTGGTNVIGDGMGGFSVYGPSGTSRYINSPTSPGKVYHPDGSSSQVIQDGAGNLDVYGPQRTHKVYRDSAPTSDKNQ